MLIYNSSNPNKEYKSTNSRYRVLRVINQDNYKYLETYNKVKIPHMDGDEYHIVAPEEDGRLDIISNNYYGTPELWWAIALANEFIDPFIVNEGSIVRIPSLISLYSIDTGVLNRR